MSDAILMAAIKKRKMEGAKMGDHVDMSHPGQHTEDADKDQDLHGIVSSLNDDQKGKLHSILSSHLSGKNEISKGSPSSEEQSKIADESQKENHENSLEAAESGNGGDGSVSAESDAIGKSLLDSRHLGANPPTGKPRNLGERMKMGVMNKLKAKGKI